MTSDKKIVKDLALQVIEKCKDRNDEIEMHTWMVVHEFRHGVLPVEYDIREIDETLYLNVLNYVKTQI